MPNAIQIISLDFFYNLAGSRSTAAIRPKIKDVKEAPRSAQIRTKIFIANLHIDKKQIPWHPFLYLAYAFWFTLTRHISHFQTPQRYAANLGQHPCPRLVQGARRELAPAPSTLGDPCNGHCTP